MKSFIKQYAIYPIGMGAMPLSISNRPPEKEAFAVINAFLEAGGNFIDTANVYGLDDTDRGHNEKLIHKALKQLGGLEKTIIATKGGATRPQGGWGLGEGHPKQLRQLCEQSLKNLEISTHTLYYLHGPDPKIPLEESVGELARLKEEGKINHIGIANVDLAEVKNALRIAPIAAIQNRCNPFCKGDFNNGLIEFCQSQDIMYVPYCPLGGWADHAKLAESEVFLDITQQYGVSSYTICLAWLLEKGKHIVPIPGMDNKEQVISNFEAHHVNLSKEAIQKIDDFPDLYVPKHEEK